jgi:hypothetical protein
MNTDLILPETKHNMNTDIILPETEHNMNTDLILPETKHNMNTVVFSAICRIPTDEAFFLNRAEGLSIALAHFFE